MKITDVRTISVEWPLPRPVYDANYVMATHQRAYKHARGGLLVAAISGIDIALWDLRGKLAGMPVWRLLGGYRRRVPAYATGGFYAEGKGRAELANEMRAYVAHGFRAVKMKVGRNSDVESSPLRAMAHRGVCEVPLAEDLARVHAVREAIGPDVRLMIDANGAWDVPTAVRAGHALEPLDSTWIRASSRNTGWSLRSRARAWGLRAVGGLGGGRSRTQFNKETP